MKRFKLSVSDLLDLVLGPVPATSKAISAKTTGTDIHNQIGAFLTSNPTSFGMGLDVPEEVKMARKVVEIVTQSLNVEGIRTEVRIEDQGLVGVADVLIHTDKGFILIDWKTGIEHERHTLQVGGYIDILENNKHQVYKAYLVMIKKGVFKVKEVEVKKARDEFRKLRRKVTF
jgi:ATP-dependent exoDNAse (exonuclease V) beta subunit